MKIIRLLFKVIVVSTIVLLVFIALFALFVSVSDWRISAEIYDNGNYPPWRISAEIYHNGRNPPNDANLIRSATVNIHRVFGKKRYFRSTEIDFINVVFSEEGSELTHDLLVGRFQRNQFVWHPIDRGAMPTVYRTELFDLVDDFKPSLFVKSLTPFALVCSVDGTELFYIFKNVETGRFNILNAQFMELMNWRGRERQLTQVCTEW